MKEELYIDLIRQMTRWAMIHLNWSAGMRSCRKWLVLGNLRADLVSI